MFVVYAAAIVAMPLREFDFTPPRFTSFAATSPHHVNGPPPLFFFIYFVAGAVCLR